MTTSLHNPLARSDEFPMTRLTPDRSVSAPTAQILRPHSSRDRDIEASAGQSYLHITREDWRCVIICVASFVIVFTCCGINFAFGVYQALFEKMAREPDTPFTGASPAQIDLIGTLGISMMTIGAPFVVAWSKRFSPQIVTFAGGVIFGLSLILASFGQRLWHFVLTQGLLLGVGTSLSYMVSVTVAPTWFTARRGLALGIILSGTGIGGLVWAPALTACIGSIGYRNTLRLTGGLSSVLVTSASAAMAWEPESKARIDTENAARASRLSGVFNVPLVDWRVAKTRKFAAHMLGAIFQAAAYYIPVFFFASYAITLGYSTSAGSNFIAISNACNALGKIVIGHAADRIGRLNTLFLTTLMSALATICFWLPSTLYGTSHESRNLFISFTIFYGIFASAYVSLFPASIVEVFGVQNFASVNGVLYMVRGMATLVGTPVGGVLIRTSTKSIGPKAYESMSVLVSCLLFAATFAVLWVRMEAMTGQRGGFNWRWKQ